ncbi:DUF3078 domain-containing protein [Winogradskyella echinorum]|uniref:DUF3078 domain-containing protein n=1 Tax=Winogradskyella echinorum TaxID=538189 RepID=A0ABR6XWV6_9FLAO|nr:DUF3078 domain-containing protein [Winogradskyella echinorum]MBC3844909.1 DUF3078 domain-containing protein [Winogradskyella echinorum]MBC5749257.1 DUF3078 domain-containing protein [Winogradskyella echinorum]
MKTNSWFILSIFIICSSHLFAQPDSLYLYKKKKKKEAVKLGWRTKKEVGLTLNQVSFTNWNSGGTNSISGIITGKASAKYKQEKWFWNSNFNIRYGLNKQADKEIRKTDDVIEVISNVGLEKDPKSNWFYSAKFSFNSQLANGYNYPNRDEPISEFLAPGYMFFGLGMEYGRHIERLSFYASPFTLKTTFVLNDELANKGAFGVDPAIYDLEGNIIKDGKKVRQELGILLTNQYQEEVFENIKVNSLLRLYTDYINSFGNIDIEWELNLDMKVNKYVKATLGSHLRYDNDIKIEVERNEMTNEEFVIEGPKLQWKQILGVGVVVDLDNIINASAKP